MKRRKSNLLLCGLLMIVGLTTACGKEPAVQESFDTAESFQISIDSDSAESTAASETTSEGENEPMSGELIQDTNDLQNDTTAIEVDMEQVTDTICPTRTSMLRGDVKYGRKEHFTYESATCGRTRGANILLPPDYSEDKQYPVLYFLHGIFGDENSMLGDSNNRIAEIVGNLREDGCIPDIIVVFPHMYASKNPALQPGFTQEQIAPYDNFINDLEKDLIPYVEANYSVMTDREHRGLIGFSMGGRESLFIGTTRSDLFSCVGAISPAPGVTPGKDWAMEHPGQMKEEEFVIRQEEYPLKLLMICCGTKDSVVGKFPASYHDILSRNQVDHLWYEVPDADHDNNAIKSGLYNYLIRWFYEE